jgi:hypothetical protein
MTVNQAKIVNATAITLEHVQVPASLAAMVANDAGFAIAA